ncbi:MAG TPA: glucose-6-phosphate dehydrogenase [Solimonas sp.]|nr:glucose-6-phosphate dehydrogenase [Solimonas sp.]
MADSLSRMPAPDVSGAALDRFDFILFGGTGDLALRKLLPALYRRHRDTADSSGWRILALGRQAMSCEEYRAFAYERCCRHMAPNELDTGWQAFARRTDYLALDATDAQGYTRLAETLGGDAARNRVFYLATAPALFAGICERLGAAGLVTPASRVVLEKPLGRDLASATRINQDVGRVFAEQQIFRIDHYLGKESVQNLLALRFGNSLFEPIWNRSGIRDVQITIAETVGVEDRGEFYDSTGALRDMVQNHLLQLLCIVAMEPPSSIESDRVRDEKLKVLQSLRPLSPADVVAKTVRGQYRAGAIAGKPAVGYVEEPGVAAGSTTETFVSIKAEVDNWRWAGVPFYLRTGKRMQERLAEIVVNFRTPPHAMLSGSLPPVNRLVIGLQPREGLRLDLMAKVPGEGMQVQPISLDMAFSDRAPMRRWDAYERLIMDVIRGRLTLFMRRDELDAAWRWVEPILDQWQRQRPPLRLYQAGTWGPTQASALTVRDGNSWHEES